MQVQVFTKEELKLLSKLKEERGWDPDLRAIIAMVEGAVARFDQSIIDQNIMDWLDDLLRRKRVACIFFDVFERGLVAVTKRSGVMGVGPDLWTALEKMVALNETIKSSSSKRLIDGLDEVGGEGDSEEG